MKLLLLLFPVILNVQAVDQNALARVLKEAKTHFGDIKNFPDFDSEHEEFNKDEDKELSVAHNFRYHINPSTNTYNYRFSGFDLERFEKGYLKNGILVVQGKYQDRTVNKDGVHIIRTFGYIADEKGYRPFLISIAFALSTASGPGAPAANRGGINSATLATLNG